MQVYSRRRIGRPFMPVLACTFAGLAPASASPAGCSPAASASPPAAWPPPAAVSSSLPSEAAWGCRPGREVLAALPPAPAIPVALEAGGSLASLAPSAAAGGALRLRGLGLPAGASAEPGAALGAAGCWLVRAACGGRGGPSAPVLWPQAGPPFAGGACSAFTAGACTVFAAGPRPCFAAGAAPGAAEAPASAAAGGASPAAGLLRVEGTWCRACTERQGTRLNPVQRVPHQCTLAGGKPSRQISTQEEVMCPTVCNSLIRQGSTELESFWWLNSCAGLPA